jgi:hypothetical protein
MATRGAFEVSEIPSERWELALDLLDRAGHMFVLPGEVSVGNQRYSGWPGADGLIHVSIFTSVEPPAVTPEMAQHDVKLGLSTVQKAAAADPRLSRMFEQYGVSYDYVNDYGHGAVRIGDADEHGVLRLL